MQVPVIGQKVLRTVAVFKSLEVGALLRFKEFVIIVAGVIGKGYPDFGAVLRLIHYVFDALLVAHPPVVHFEFLIHRVEQDIGSMIEIDILIRVHQDNGKEAIAHSQEDDAYEKIAQYCFLQGEYLTDSV